MEHKEKRRGSSPACISYYWALMAAVIYRIFVPVGGLTFIGAALDFVSLLGLLWVLFYLIIRAIIAQVEKAADNERGE